MKSVGVALASVIASLAILLIVVNYSKELINLKQLLSISWRYFVASVVMYISIFKINLHNHWMTIIGQVVVGMIIYFMVLIVLKDTIIRKVLKQSEKKLFL